MLSDLGDCVFERFLNLRASPGWRRQPLDSKVADTKLGSVPAHVDVVEAHALYVDERQHSSGPLLCQWSQRRCPLLASLQHRLLRQRRGGHVWLVGGSAVRLRHASSLCACRLANSRRCDGWTGYGLRTSGCVGAD